MIGPMRHPLHCVACLFVIVLGVAGCRSTPPEEALRESVGELQAALEARDARAISGLLAEDFVGPGGMDRTATRRTAAMSFQRYRKVGIALGPLDIVMHERNATVRFTAALTGGQRGWLPESGSVYQVETGWRRDGDDWVLTSARWDRNL